MPLVGAHWRSLALIARAPRPRDPRQGVHENIQYTTALQPWAEDEPRVSKCVFIGRDLDHDMLRSKWEMCIQQDPALTAPASTQRGLLGAAADGISKMLS